MQLHCLPLLVLNNNRKLLLSIYIVQVFTAVQSL
jgi:hypothetical protein